jgi:hypothetical protein
MFEVGEKAQSGGRWTFQSTPTSIEVGDAVGRRIHENKPDLVLIMITEEKSREKPRLKKPAIFASFFGKKRPVGARVCLQFPLVLSHPHPISLRLNPRQPYGYR